MAKTKLENGIRVNLDTGLPAPASTEKQGQALSKLAPTSISSAELTPQKDFTLPVAPPLSEGAGLQEQIKSTADQFTQNLEKKTKEAEAKRITSFDELANVLAGQKGETERTTEAYATGGVDALQSELTDINQQILSEEQALRRQVERIQTAPGTATASERDRAVQEATRNSLRKQADLSVIQLTKQGRYSEAKAVADRAVAVQLEKQRQDIDLRQKIFEENKDLFTVAEQREFETKQKAREREFAMEDFRLKADYEQKIKESDPLYQARLKKARAEANAVGTPNGINVNQITDPTLSDAQKNSAGLTYLLSQNIGQGTRTNVANILGVINAAEDMAENNTSGQFEGINPLTGILDTKLPVFGVGLPFRETVKSAKQIQNEGYIEAINLRVQTWASGAALTEAQTEQVNRFTPNKSDTDQAVRTKLNNLSNFMLTQAQSQLQSEGINFEPKKVDLFAPTKKSLLTPDEESELDSAFSQSTPASSYYRE